MKTFCYVNYYKKIFKNACLHAYSTTSGSKNVQNFEKYRNIGILAHIDAGKTTTTERMLYYSGTIKSMGEVHHGNTVTDYMEQERQRGITITSAAVSFPWRDNQINLIDTPGHIDFTMEVEQSLAVLDGAVLVLDASAGVEAQTLTVWRQSVGYRVPRIFYLNKMDRSDANVENCLQSIQDKLDAQPLLLHLPVRNNDGKLIGLVDLVTQEEIIWTTGRGQKYTRRKLTEEDGAKWEHVMKRHRMLIDTISSIDDEIADIIIQEESLDNIKVDQINEAIKRCTISMNAFPVLCGSSYKNIGVQTLMDGVILYLPSPSHCSQLYKCFANDLAARVFKIQHDDQRGVLTFMRLYSGEIGKGQKIFNLRQDRSEQAGGLYVAYADEYQTVECVTAGNIAVLSGLKDTVTGDLVTSTQSAASRAKERLVNTLADEKMVHELVLPSAKVRLQALEGEPSREEIADVLLGRGTVIPEPVFLCSIEPPSPAFQTPLEVALAELQREDPSLRIHYNDESGQIVLSGMGELHLEIIKERIIREYKIEVELGDLQIAYRESLTEAARDTMVVERKIGSVKQSVKVNLSVKPKKGVTHDKIFRLDKSPDSASNLASIWQRHLTAVKQGVETGLMHGPKLACPVIDVQVTLHWLEVGRGTSDSVLSATVVQCLRKVMEQSESMLLEPVMSLEIVCPESHSSSVMADLTRRRAQILHIHLRQHNKVIECLAPLSELVGYSTALRSLSSGLATLSMAFNCYRQMSPQDEQQAIRAITGF